MIRLHIGECVRICRVNQRSVTVEADEVGASVFVFAVAEITVGTEWLHARPQDLVASILPMRGT